MALNRWHLRLKYVTGCRFFCVIFLYLFVVFSVSTVNEAELRLRDVFIVMYLCVFTVLSEVNSSS
jgi:hypothetical protein